MRALFLFDNNFLYLQLVLVATLAICCIASTAAYARNKLSFTPSTYLPAAHQHYSEPIYPATSKTPAYAASATAYPSDYDAADEYYSPLSYDDVRRLKYYSFLKN